MIRSAARSKLGTMAAAAKAKKRRPLKRSRARDSGALLPPSDLYNQMAHDKEGRAWLALHPEAGHAFGLSAQLLVYANLLADRALEPERRADIRRRVYAASMGIYGSGESLVTTKQKAIVDALNASLSPLLEKLSEEDTRRIEVWSVRTKLSMADPEASKRVPDELIRAAIAKWCTKRSRKWDAANDIAKQFGCGCASGNVFRARAGSLP